MSQSDLRDDELDRLLGALATSTDEAPPVGAMIARVRRRRRRIICARTGVGVALACGVAIFVLSAARSDNGPTVRATGTTATTSPAPGRSDSSTQPTVFAPADVSSALEEQYPTIFGGVVTTGEGSINVYAVRDTPDFRAGVARIVNSRFAVTIKPSNTTLVATRSLESQMQSDEPSLQLPGTSIIGLGIRIESDGPRVLVVLSKDSPQAKSELQNRYGPNTLTFFIGGGIVEN